MLVGTERTCETCNSSIVRVQEITPSELGINSFHFVSSPSADINLSSHESGVGETLAARLSAELSTDGEEASFCVDFPITFVVTGYYPMSSVRSLSFCDDQLLDNMECTISMVSCTNVCDEEDSSLKMEVLITGDEHTYNCVFQRICMVDLLPSYGSIRTSVRGRVIREVSCPVDCDGDYCVCFRSFLEALHFFDYQIDYCELSHGYYCDRLKPLALRSLAVRMLEKRFSDLLVPCDFENQGKTHRSHKPGQDPEIADRIRSYLARVNDLNGKLVEIESRLCETTGKEQERLIGRMLVVNERLRRQNECVRNIFREVYPSIDFRVKGKIKYENHALDAKLVANYLADSTEFVPTVLAFLADGVSVLHHLSKCTSKTDYFIFVAGLLGRFFRDSDKVSDLTTFVMDAISDDCVSDEEGFQNQAEPHVAVSCSKTIIHMLASQWHFLRKVLAVLLVFLMTDAKDLSAVVPGLVSAAVGWVIGFSADVKDLPKLIVEIFSELSVRVYRVFHTGDLTSLFEDSAPTLFKRCVDFCNNGVSMLTKMEVMSEIITPMEMPELIAEGADLVKLLEIAIKTSSATPDGLSSRGHAVNSLREVLAVYRKLQHFATMPSRRRCPFGVLLVGPAGVGKSEAIPTIFTVVMPKVTGVPYSPSLVAPINPIEQFQSVPTAQHIGITMDDLGQGLDPTGAAYKLIFDLASNTPFYYTKADLDSKGTVPTACQVLIATSNDINMGAAGKVASMSALARRFVVVTFDLRPECVGGDGKFYANPEFLNDYWVCSLILRLPAYVPRGTEWNPHAIVDKFYTTSDGVECNGVCFSVILKGLAELATEHRIKQEDMEALQVNKSMTSICPDCDTLKAYCRCSPILENQGLTSSYMKRRRTPRSYHVVTERSLAEGAIEYPWYDRIWYNIPGVRQLEGYFLSRLIGNHDRFSSAAKKISTIGVGLSLFTVSVSGASLISTIACLSCGIVKRTIAKVEYLKDVSRSKPRDSQSQQKLVRRFSQFFAVGSTLVSGYLVFKLITSLMDFVTKAGNEDRATQNNEESVPSVVYPNQAMLDPIESSLSEASEGETSANEIPVGSVPYLHRNTWRPFTDLTDLRRKTGGDVTMDFALVQRRIHDSMCRVTVFQDEEPLTTVHGVFVKSNILLVNNHAVQKGNKLRIAFQGSNAANSVKSSPLHPNLMHVLPDAVGGNKDLCLITIVSMPAIRDITRHICEVVVDDVPAILMKYHPEGLDKQRTVVRLDTLKQPYIDGDGIERFSHMTVYHYVVSQHSAAGDCGSVLVTAGASPLIIGMHCCGHREHSVAVSFTKGDIERGIECLVNKDRMFNHGLTLTLNYLPELAEENKLSFIHKLPVASNTAPIANTTVKVIRPRYKSKNYGFKDNLGLVCAEFGPPRKEPTWMRPFSTLLKTGNPAKCSAELNAMHFAVEDYIKTVDSRAPSGLFDNVRILTLDEVLNGVPELGLPGIDFSKSAGFTLGKLGGSKEQYVELDEFNRWRLVPELQHRYDEYYAAFMSDSDEVPNLIFNAFAKDELRKVVDGVAKYHRAIYAGDFLGLIFEQQCFKSLLCCAVAAQPFVFETALGMNAYRDIDATVKYLKIHPFEPEKAQNRCVYGDYAQFDQTKLQTDQLMEREVDIRLLERCPNVSDVERRFASRVKFAVLSSPILLNSELVFTILGPSGKYCTFWDNSKTCSLRPRMVYSLKYPDSIPGEFGQNCRVLTGGDDHCLNNLLPNRTVGMMDLFKFCSEVGMGYTDPEKNVPTVQFSADSDFEFFKRTLVSADSLVKGTGSFILGALDKNSICKTLLGGSRDIFDGEGSPTQKELYVQASMSSLMEALLHGEEYYEDIRSRLFNLFADWDVIDWIRDDQTEPFVIRAPTFIAKMEHEARERGLMTFS